MGGGMKIEIVVDETRLSEIGDPSSPAAIRKLVAALQQDTKLSVQSRDYWRPVKDLKITDPSKPAQDGPESLLAESGAAGPFVRVSR
jgi:hypothetical protein